MLHTGTRLTASGNTLVMTPLIPVKQSTPAALGEFDRDEFLRETKQLFWSPLKIPKMLAMSDQLQEQLREKMQSSDICMLPSYKYTLPTGHERGSYLALDIGGSTCRVALVELSGRDNGRECISIVKMNSYRIGNTIKALRGQDFFEWIAGKIGETLQDPALSQLHGTEPLSMGLSWSFPIQYDHPSAKSSHRS
jgi:hexokinase